MVVAHSRGLIFGLEDILTSAHDEPCTYVRTYAMCFSSRQPHKRYNRDDNRDFHTHTHRSGRQHVYGELAFDVAWNEELGHDVRRPELSVLVDGATEPEPNVCRAPPHVLRKVESGRGDFWVAVVVAHPLSLHKRRKKQGGTAGVGEADKPVRQSELNWLLFRELSTVDYLVLGSTNQAGFISHSSWRLSPDEKKIGRTESRAHWPQLA